MSVCKISFTPSKCFHVFPLNFLLLDSSMVSSKYSLESLNKYFLCHWVRVRIFLSVKFWKENSMKKRLVKITEINKGTDRNYLNPIRRHMTLYLQIGVIKVSIQIKQYSSFSDNLQTVLHSMSNEVQSETWVLSETQGCLFKEEK